MITYQPMAGMVDSEHSLFLVRGADLVGSPTGEIEADLIEWVPMAEIPAMIARGDIWTSGTLIGLFAARIGSTQRAADGSGEFFDASALPAGAGHRRKMLGALDVGLGGIWLSRARRAWPRSQRTPDSARL